MQSEPASQTEPAPADFAGQTARRLFHATRPKFFPASVLPVVAGTAWGVYIGGSFDAVLFTLALVATICVHAGANVLNDVGDETGGTDRQNTDRIYPYTGGSRFIQAGIMDTNAMARLGISLLAVAAVAGFLLILLRGPVVLWFGLAGVMLAVLYSLGPVRLASLGLGELAVAVAFGVLPVVGSAWLQSGVVDLNAVMFSIPVSAWVAAILLINGVPDIQADSATGKRTLPVRLGNGGTAVLYIGIHILALATTVHLAAVGLLPIIAPLVPALALFLVFKAAAAIKTGVEDRTTMTAGIEATLAVHTIGSLWLAGLAIFRVFWPG